MRLVMSPNARSASVMAAVGALLVPGAALAQTATGASITQGPQTAPERFLNFNQPNQQDLGIATRSTGLNPTGVNYSDCVSDMTLGFPVVLNGFGVGNNSDAMQIWASANGTCTFDQERGNGGIASCWLVNNGFAAGTPANGVSQSFYVRVQDLVGPQQAPPNPPMGVVHEGASACLAQPSFAAVPITLWFVPLSSENTFDMNAQALSWTVGTDLVGPPAPSGLTVGAGQALLIAQWTANPDSDTVGYDVFIDPPPGSPAQAMSTTQVVCPTSSSSSSASITITSGSTPQDAAMGSADATADETADTADDSADATADETGGAADATTGSPSSSSASSASSTSSSSVSSSSTSNAADAGCVTVNVVEVPPSTNSCTSAVLGSAMPADSGASSEGNAGDDAALDDGGVVEGAGGIATIPCQYAVNVGCPAGSPIYTESSQITVTGETTTSAQITGLTDNVTYAVAVSAVDSFGNPGPPSSPLCNFPAPVIDFFDLYRDAGGQAGGGFCAIRGGTRLEASSDSPVGSWIALGTAGVAALAAGRRRRGRTRRAR